MFTLSLYYLAIKNKFDKIYERFEIINIFFIHLYFKYDHF